MEVPCKLCGAVLPPQAGSGGLPGASPRAPKLGRGAQPPSFETICPE